MTLDRRFAPRWAAFRHNAKQFLIAVDQGLNALLGLLLGLAGLLYLLPRPAGFWWADETISAYCWRWELSGVRRLPRLLVDALARCWGRYQPLPGKLRVRASGPPAPPGGTLLPLTSCLQPAGLQLPRTGLKGEPWPLKVWQRWKSWKR